MRGLALAASDVHFDMQSIGRGSADRVDRPDPKAEVEAGGIPWRELVHHAVDAHRVGRRERAHAEQGRDRHEKDGRLTPPLATVVVVVSMKQMTERCSAHSAVPEAMRAYLPAGRASFSISVRWLVRSPSAPSA
jgi:hypothetical protein